MQIETKKRICNQQQIKKRESPNYFNLLLRMKKQVLLLGLALLTIISLTTTSCDLNFEGLCEQATGDEVSYLYDLDEITDIALSLGVDVHLKKGGDQEILIKGKEDALDRLNFDVVSGLWEIRFEDGECMKNHDIKIEITVQDIHSLKVSGSGRIYADSETMYLDHLIDLKVSGSGKVYLDVDAPKVQGKISGSGDIDLTGLTPELEATISGSGKFRAFDLTATNVDLKITGSGNSEVFVDNGLLNVDISGSGKVYYKGAPNSITMDVTGSGELIDAN